MPEKNTNMLKLLPKIEFKHLNCDLDTSARMQFQHAQMIYLVKGSYEKQRGHLQTLEIIRGYKLRAL